MKELDKQQQQHQKEVTINGNSSSTININATDSSIGSVGVGSTLSLPGLGLEPEMIDLLNEYLFFCKNKYIVSDHESIFGPEYDQWELHRHDQSILTNLIVKHNLSCSNVFFNHVSHNIHPPL